MRTVFSKRLLLIPVLVIFVISGAHAQFEAGLKDPVQVGVINGSQAFPASNTVTIYPTQQETSKKIQNIIWFKLNELAPTSGANGAPLLYFKSGFTATVTLSVGVWANLAVNNSATPDQTLTPTIPLVVNYDLTTGNAYNPIAYWLIPGTNAYEQVKVTVTNISITGLSNGWTATNVLPLLSVENEMRVLRYFTNPALSAPTITQVYDVVNHADQLSLSWPFPVGANTSQLEYAWVENESKSYYFEAGIFSPDKLFRENSTRVDNDTSSKIFNIPLLFDADPSKTGGTLYYRVRCALRNKDGSLVTGSWSAPQTFLYNGHEKDLNWQSSTSFAENGKSKTVIQYFDGSMRPRQTVTKDNSTGNTTVAETIYDLQGRPNVQILPTPTISAVIGYYKDFNRFSGQTTFDDPSKYFDLSIAGAQCNGAPQLDITKGNGIYYSVNNPWKTSETAAKFIPDANGYAYTETRFTDDPTQRVSSQGGVGKAHQIGSGHETKYFYGKPNQNELDALFGTEAGDASHYFKNMVQDANGQMSVSYTDMHGRTVATALAGSAPTQMTDINTNTAFYPVSSGQLTGNLLTPATNIIKNNSIEAISTILVPAASTYDFSYQLTPAILQQMNCNSQQICFDCKYDLEISIRQENCSANTAITKRYNNLQIVPANQACGTPMGFIGDNGSTPQTQIAFSVPLTPGSWVVSKTLSINDSMFRVRRDSALTAFLCKTQQTISDSVFNSLSAISDCNTAPVTRNCNACQLLLGSSYSTSNYKANFITAAGGDATSFTDAAIHAQYSLDSIACASACGTITNPVFNTLAGIRSQMLNDMIPYTGQYAIRPDSIASLSRLEAKYNIFTSSFSNIYGFGQFTNGTKPFYLNPVAEPNGTASSYTLSDGSVDYTIYPTGVPGPLVNISTDSFSNLFNRDWAGKLIYYHPEYGKLRFAETSLLSTYTWMDKVSQCNTYAQALANGYLTPLTSDPYFVNNIVPADKNNMIRYLTQYTGKYDSGYPADSTTTLKLSIWRIANGQVLCDTTLPLKFRQSCMVSLNGTGIDVAASSTAQKDGVWQAFKALYFGSRNDMVISYINNQQASSLSSVAMDTLMREGKQLRFANSTTIAQQNGLTWWAVATDTVNMVDSVTMTTIANNFIAANTIDPCIAQKPFWKARLLQCEQLQQYLANQTSTDSVKVNDIITKIVDSMAMVCSFSKNNDNPYGASNVNPAYMPKVPANFEDIVNHVFRQNNIDTLPGNNYFCNPYSIDYPKPFNTNPQVFVNNRATLDTCNCQQFKSIKSTAKAAGYDTTSLSSMNTYLLANYNDTLTSSLWQGLLQCNSHYWFQDTCYYRTILTSSAKYSSTGKASFLITPDSCVHLYFLPIALNTATIIPSFLNCGYSKPCITCSTVQNNTAAFRLLYPAYAGVPYTNNVDTGKAKQNALWARYLNFKTGFNKTFTEYAAAFLNCGLSTGSADLDISDRYLQPPYGSASPFTYTASNSITFSPGFISLPDDIFEVNIVATTGSAGTALCAFEKPVTYIPLPDTTSKNSCQAIQYEANFIAQELFQKQKDSLIANFDSLYRVKCLGAQATEIFKYTYTPKEYHYTLYYYDQAGNLLKTLPPASVMPNFDATYLASVQSNRLVGADQYNGTNVESMATQYRYNTLNQVIAQKTPDAGNSNFWYDRLGRLSISQNAKQKLAASYSYTLYDPLGRITEVGQKPQSALMTQVTSQDATALQSWLDNLTTGAAKQQITRTVYDIAYPSFTGTAPIAQQNLRNRVSYSQIIDVDNGGVPPYKTATFYGYDIHGNVDTLVQDYGPNSVMGTATGNRFKTIKYAYDLISGKVNQVSYQPGLADGFYHQYVYDAENRLTSVRTSRDSILWQNDAAYSYYRHGPLARTQLGHLQVQGIDYAYTLHGWLKSVNPSSVNISSDLYDGDGTTTPPLFAKDAYKFNLNYYDDGTVTDYTPIAPPAGYIQGNGLPSGSKNNLYNGNIGSMAVNIRQLAAQSSSAYAGPLIYNYKYDQLNRISSMDAWQANGSFTPSGTVPLTDFAERYTYDPNGNILTLSRNDTTGNGGQPAMDNLTYQYEKNAAGQILSNKLRYVHDQVADANYPEDINSQTALSLAQVQAEKSISLSTDNFQYDAIGNLIKDTKEGITDISWSVYGKILSITKGGVTITYTYDASGNRISKNSAGITTWYVRDASGNVMSVYVQGDNTKNSGSLTQTEIHLYGSSRLGILNSNLNCVNLAVSSVQSIFTRGSKFFELSNHLGNVLVTVSDKKLQHTNDNSTVDYYNADIITANDYYPFGMVIPGRKYSAGSGYRYGFNGKENDNEVKGEGNQQDYGMRIYDPRLGRFLSVDPLYKSFAMLTPYQFASNTPIAAIDLDGLEAKIVTTSYYINENGTKMKRVKEDDVKNPYNLGMGVLKIDIKYKNEIPSSVESTVYEYTPQTAMSKFLGISRWFGTQKNEFGFVLTGNSNGTSIDVGSDGVQFKESLDLGVLLKVMSAIRDVAPEKSTITDGMNDKSKFYYNLVKSTMKLFGQLADDTDKLLPGNVPSTSNTTTPATTPEKLDLLPEIKTKKGDCSICGEKNSDSSHVNGVAREVNKARTKEATKNQ